MANNKDSKPNSREDKEDRNNRRNRGSDGTGGGNNDVRKNDDRKSGQNRDDRPPRGGPGGRGGRGGRGGGRGGKREFERKSGDDRTGVKSVDKRDGSGSHNWGTYEDDIKAEQDQANTSTDENGQPIDPANDAAKSDDKTTNGVAEREVEREPEEITYTLDEWKAQQAKKEETKFNLRKAGEGSDLDPKWKKTYAYKKKKETHDEEDEEESELYPQRVHRQKKIATLNSTSRI